MTLFASEHPLVLAAFERGFDCESISTLNESSERVNAGGLVVFVEAPTPEWGSGFFFFLVGSRIAVDPNRRMSANALAQALAASSRAALYSAGFSAPENPLNDYPSASFLLSQDIACAQIALTAPKGMSRPDAVALAQQIAEKSAGALFGSMLAVSKAALPELRRHKVFDALANEAIVQLRSRLRAAQDEKLC